MKKFLTIALLVGVMVFLQGCSNGSEDTTTDTDTSTEETPADSPDNSQSETPGSITMAQVSQHNQPDDCWMVIDNKVYDVSEYVPFHPGEERITEGCGKEATELFNTQGGEGTHPQNARDILETYYIGDLN